MAAKTVKIWLDPEGDFLEVLLDPSKPGHFRETADDRIMEKVDDQGNVIGFSILHVSSIKAPAPFELALT